MTLYPARLMLLPVDIREADALTARRREENIRKGRVGTNNQTSDLTVLLANTQHGVRCEYAGWLYFWPKCEWDRFSEDPIGKADYDGWIDAKGIEQPHHKLLVPLNPHDNWAYLLVGSYDHPWYEIVGWCWGHEARTVPVTEPRPNRPCHAVSREESFFKSPGLLFEEQRRRWKPSSGKP